MRWLTEHNIPRKHKNFQNNATNLVKIIGSNGSEEEGKGSSVGGKHMSFNNCSSLIFYYTQQKACRNSKPSLHHLLFPRHHELPYSFLSPEPHNIQIPHLLLYALHLHLLLLHYHWAPYASFDPLPGNS